MTSLECNPYLDTTSFFRINDEPKESKDMLENCDQSKLLQIDYLDRLQPMGLYGNQFSSRSLPDIVSMISLISCRF